MFKKKEEETKNEFDIVSTVKKLLEEEACPFCGSKLIILKVFYDPIILTCSKCNLRFIYRPEKGKYDMMGIKSNTIPLMLER